MSCLPPSSVRSLSKTHKRTQINGSNTHPCLLNTLDSYVFIIRNTPEHTDHTLCRPTMQHIYTLTRVSKRVCRQKVLATLIKAIDHCGRRYKNINYLKINATLTPGVHLLTLHLGPGRKLGPTGPGESCFSAYRKHSYIAFLENWVLSAI